MENLQMATPDMNGDDLGDMIHEQQDLRDRTFRASAFTTSRSGDMSTPWP
jgi:hypothetical protein